jgi:hypothetical protein
VVISEKSGPTRSRSRSRSRTAKKRRESQRREDRRGRGRGQGREPQRRGGSLSGERTDEVEVRSGPVEVENRSEEVEVSEQVEAVAPMETKGGTEMEVFNVNKADHNCGERRAKMRAED